MTKRIPADWRARYAADQPPLTEEEMTLPHLPWPPLSRRGMEDRMTQDTTTQGRATLYRKIAAVMTGPDTGGCYGRWADRITGDYRDQEPLDG